jgi:hypothetical protein
MQEDTIDTESKVAYIYQNLLILFLQEQKTESEVLEYLMLEGMDRPDAELMIANTKAVIYQVKKPRAVRNFFLGIPLALFGLATMISFFWVRPQSLYVFITLGILVLGFIKITESIKTLKEIARFENRSTLFKLPNIKELFNSLKTLEKRYRVSNHDGRDA